MTGLVISKSIPITGRKGNRWRTCKPTFAICIWISRAVKSLECESLLS